MQKEWGTRETLQEMRSKEEVMEERFCERKREADEIAFQKSSCITVIKVSDARFFCIKVVSGSGRMLATK
jgi:hypothetical protein